jgi:hypothetical protein
MNKVTNLDIYQQHILPPRPQYNDNQQQQGNQGWNPRPPNEKRVPNTFAPTNVINQEDVPWCFPCGD